MKENTLFEIAKYIINGGKIKSKVILDKRKRIITNEIKNKNLNEKCFILKISLNK